jgi:translation initiation factor IF-3
VKARRAGQFLDHGDRVKVTVRFRGREISHANLGRDLLMRSARPMPTAQCRQPERPPRRRRAATRSATRSQRRGPSPRPRPKRPHSRDNRTPCRR